MTNERNNINYNRLENRTQVRNDKYSLESLPIDGTAALKASPQFIDPTSENTNHTLIDTVPRMSSWGVQVLPGIYGKKRPSFGWQPFQHYRMRWHDPRYTGDIQWLFSGRCNLIAITGRVSAGLGQSLAVIDFDTQRGYENAVQAFIDEFGRVFAVRSSRGGHIWIFIEDGVLKNSSTNDNDAYRIKDAEVLGRNKVIVLPPSVKIADDGTTYAYEFDERTDPYTPPPVVSIADLQRALPLRTEGGEIYKYQKHTTARYTPTAQGQADRNALAEYRRTASTETQGKRNTTTFNYMGCLLRQGYSVNEARQEVTAAMIQTGLDASEIERTVQSAIKGFNAPQTTKRAAIWKHARAYANAQTWGGRNGKRDRAVFGALVERCKLDADAQGAYRATMREVAELADISKGAAERGINALLDARLIENVSRASDNTEWHTAGRYVFTENVTSWDTNALKGLGDEGYSVPLIDKGTQTGKTLAALRNTLGHIGVKIYRYLCSQDTPCRVADIARAIGHHRHTVTDYLSADRELISRGLIHKNGYLYTAMPDAMKLEHTAQDTGAYDAQAQRTDRYNHERQVRLMQIIYKARRTFEYHNMGGKGASLPKVTEYREMYKGKVIEFSQADSPSAGDELEQWLQAMISDCESAGGVIREDTNEAPQDASTPHEPMYMPEYGDVMHPSPDDYEAYADMIFSEDFRHE